MTRGHSVRHDGAHTIIRFLVKNNEIRKCCVFSSSLDLVVICTQFPINVSDPFPQKKKRNTEVYTGADVGAKLNFRDVLSYFFSGDKQNGSEVVANFFRKQSRYTYYIQVSAAVRDFQVSTGKRDGMEGQQDNNCSGRFLPSTAVSSLRSGNATQPLKKSEAACQLHT